MRYSLFSGSKCPLLNISSMGFSKSTAVTRFGPGVRNSFIVHFVISGKGYFNGNAVLAGQGFLITPGMSEYYFPDKKDPWEFLWFTSKDPIMGNLFPLFNADNNTHIFNYSYIYAIEELAGFLKNNKHRFLDGFEILELFLKIFKYQQKNDLIQKKKTNSQVYIEAAEKYILSNLHQATTVSELTEFLGVSQPYLFKIFKEHFSKSPKQYILDEKLSKAKKLLIETDISVTQIANSIGFQDVLSFSKFFKSKVNVSPLNYREINR